MKLGTREHAALADDAYNDHSKDIGSEKIIAVDGVRYRILAAADRPSGCAAMVISDDMHTTNNAATVDEAIRKGMNTCSQVATNCRVYCSACSPPVRIR